MNNLRQTLETSISTLDQAHEYLTRNREALRNTCSPPVFDDWDRLANLNQRLKETRPLLIRQDIAKKELDSFDEHIRRSATKRQRECVVRHCQVDMPICIARDLVLAAYIVQTWSIFDRVANVAGRLMSSSNISRNAMAASNPKLSGYFVLPDIDNEKNKEAKIRSFSIDEYLRGILDWQIAAASRIRNCVVHDGGYIGSKPLFTGDLVRDVFKLDVNVAQELNTQLENIYRNRPLTLIRSRSSFRFENDDLRKQLYVLHEDVELAVSLLIGWGCDAFLALLRHFSYLVIDAPTCVWL